MTKFTSFDRQNLKNLRTEMQALMDKYGVKSNLEITVGNMSFDNTEVSIKVKAKVKGAETQEDVLLALEMKRLGLKSTNKLGQTLVMYKPRSYKMPFVYSNASGKMFKCCPNTAKKMFAV